MRTTIWRVCRLSVEDFNIHACTIYFSKWCFSLILVMLLFTRHHLHFHFHLIMLALSVSLLLGRERITPGNRGLHELLTCFGVFSRAVKASLILLARVLTFSDTFYFELWIYRSRISLQNLLWSIDKRLFVTGGVILQKIYAWMHFIECILFSFDIYSHR